MLLISEVAGLVFSNELLKMKFNKAITLMNIIFLCYNNILFFYFHFDKSHYDDYPGQIISTKVSILGGQTDITYNIAQKLEYSLIDSFCITVDFKCFHIYMTVSLQVDTNTPTDFIIRSDKYRLCITIM